MSEPVKEKEQRELATSRLLDLLRSQQTAEPKESPKDIAREKPSKGGEIFEKTLSEDKAGQEQVTSKSLLDSLAKGKPGEAAESRSSPATGTPEDTAIQSQLTEEHVTSKSLLDSLSKTQSKVQESPLDNTVQDDTATIPKSIFKKPPAAPEDQAPDLLKKVKTRAPSGRETKSESTVITEKADRPIKPGVEDLTKSIPTDILQQIQAQPSAGSSEEEKEIEPVEFDTALFSEYSGLIKKPGIHEYIKFIFRYLNESRRRITVYYEENCIRLLQLFLGLKFVTVEKAATFTVPFQAEDRIINDLNELLIYVLENVIEAQYRKSVFAGLYTPKITSRTRIIQTPIVKKNELSDLVVWNVKKNLPFSPDLAAINWESFPAIGDTSKNTVVIGIAEANQLEESISTFREFKVKLRLFSTIPILLWKLFIQNYPDRKQGCFAVVNIGEVQTTIAVIIDHKLVFSRELVVGAQDFYKAVQQKVKADGKAIEIDKIQAQKILHDYGIPDHSSGLAQGLKVSLYKISIFLRPVVERLTKELNRSLSYFKKQNPDIDWESMYLDGIGATFPNLVDRLKENLDIELELLNPVRAGKYSFSEGGVIQDQLMPTYSLNFGLASEETEKINILPKKYIMSYRYIFLSKFAASLLAFFIPFYTMTTFLTNTKVKNMEKEVTSQNNQWDRLSSQSKEYFDLISDIEILNAFRKYLTNDRIFSKNQIAILKILSTTTTNEIKLTSLVFKKEVGENPGSVKPNNSYLDILEISGFVQSDPSVADIQLTNFEIQLERLGVFSKVDLTIQEQSEVQDWKLFFTAELRW